MTTPHITWPRSLLAMQNPCKCCIRWNHCNTVSPWQQCVWSHDTQRILIDFNLNSVKQTNINVCYWFTVSRCWGSLVCFRFPDVYDQWFNRIQMLKINVFCSRCWVFLPLPGNLHSNEPVLLLVAQPMASRSSRDVLFVDTSYWLGPCVTSLQRVGGGGAKEQRTNRRFHSSLSFSSW